MLILFVKRKRNEQQILEQLTYVNKQKSNKEKNVEKGYYFFLIVVSKN